MPWPTDLAFYAGSYDRTGGTVLGARMEIKSFRLLPAGCNGDTCQPSKVAPAPECTEIVCDPGQEDADDNAYNG